MVAHCISQLGDARLSLEAGRLRTRLMQTRAPRRDSDLVVASPSRIENSVPVARCGKSYPITKKGLIITDDTSSSLSSMMWVPFNKPIIKGDKHEYRRGATTYLSQHVPKWIRKSSSASDPRVCKTALSGVRYHNQALARHKSTSVFSST